MKDKGNAHFATKDYQAAINFYSTCVAADPTFMPAYLNRAAARLALKDYRGAILDCKSVLDIDSTQVKAWFR